MTRKKFLRRIPLFQFLCTPLCPSHIIHISKVCFIVSNRFPVRRGGDEMKIYYTFNYTACMWLRSKSIFIHLPLLHTYLLANINLKLIALATNNYNTCSYKISNIHPPDPSRLVTPADRGVSVLFQKMFGACRRKQVY